MQALWLCHKVLGEKSQNRRRRKRTLIEWDNFINLTDNKDYEGIPKITVRSVSDAYENNK